MTATTTKNPSTRTAKPAPAKPAPTTPKTEAAPKPKAEKPAKPEPKTLIEALTTGQAVLLKVRANGTKRSLPYYAVGSEYRVLAEAAAKMKADGTTVEAIAKETKVSLATARRFLTGLALAQDVEAGKHDKAWKPGTTEVVVHTVTAKA
jgi:hypothetical protein